MLEIELARNGSDADASAAAHHVGAALKEALGLHVPIRIAESGSLPRFEMKSRRFVIREGV
jgi:phenylacetate-coenzyme A ligase PaaK-like adenylate-forming protein